tara:strand:+ start:4072 stop:4329 length:258 start_codon:yes stop_codon:yes gene_type:complete
MKFVDHDGDEFELHREELSSIMSPPESIEGAIRLASVAFLGGMYSPYRDDTVEEIQEFLYGRGLSKEASEYSANEGYKLFKKMKG